MDFPNIACVIRTYDNNASIEKSVVRALRNGVGLIVVVNNAHDPQLRGNTLGWLSKLIGGNRNRIILVEMESGWTWSHALNAGFRNVERVNEDRILSGLSPYEFVLNASNEALWEADHLAQMLKRMNETSVFGAVGTSFAAYQNGNEIELGRSYQKPRNTFMLVRLAAYKQVGGYDPACDDFGGMEDMHWIIRMEAQRLLRDQLDPKSAEKVVPYVFVMLDLHVKLLVGVNHHQPTKEAREIQSIRRILAFEQTKARLLLHGTLCELQVEDLVS